MLLLFQVGGKVERGVGGRPLVTSAEMRLLEDVVDGGWWSRGKRSRMHDNGSWRRDPGFISASVGGGLVLIVLVRTTLFEVFARLFKLRLLVGLLCTLWILFGTAGFWRALWRELNARRSARGRVQGGVDGRLLSALPPLLLPIKFAFARGYGRCQSDGIL